MSRSIPFIPNSPDDLHCLQAAVSMIVQGLTGRQVSMLQAEELTAYVDGKATWQFAALLGMADMGLRVTDVERFDPYEFVRDPISSIEKQVGDTETAKGIIAITDLDRETSFVSRCLAHANVSFENRVPTLDELASELQQGALAICAVNSRLLTGKEGYVGHSVVVLDIDDSNVTLHDPGLPPVENQIVDRARFTRAWHYPSETMANMIVVKTVES